MSLRQLVEGDCGGVNPLMQLGGQFSRDFARKDEGYTQAQFERGLRPEEQMVNDFLGQVAAPPQSFQMQSLLQEMREIEQTSIGAAPLHAAPRVIDEVTGHWAKEYEQLSQPAPPHMTYAQPQQQQLLHVREFFDDAPSTSMYAARPFVGMPPLAICPPYVQTATTEQFFNKETTGVIAADNQLPKALQGETMEDWINDYQTSKEEGEQTASNYNEKFWQRLQEEWQKLSEESEHPWLTEQDSYDPYDEYELEQENPMADVENVFEKGKEYLKNHDIPSAVLCFEVAARNDTENAEIWEYLGMAQAENEMDPESIAALKRALALQPNNLRVIMGIAIGYTNESFQSKALQMLTNWVQANPKYAHLLEKHPELQADGSKDMSSLIRGDKLHELQQVFLEAARLNPQTIDPDVQEVLGVLYNLSSEFDKAVDCFRAALSVDPRNAKVWNRLGASLANGSRSVEAVDAYQHALELEPGFIRARYNVGVCCMNLKAYKQAVEHLLIAINMQANSAALKEYPKAAAYVSHQNISDSAWATLKMVLSLMGRSDLQSYANQHNLEALNAAFKE